jgi:hypothetical protein
LASWYGLLRKSLDTCYLKRQGYQTFRIDHINYLAQQDIDFQTSKILNLKHYISLQEADEPDNN